MVGQQRVFKYSDHDLDDYVQHDGSVVEVAHETGQTSEDPGPTYQINAADGWYGYAYADELHDCPPEYAL